MNKLLLLFLLWLPPGIGIESQGNDIAALSPHPELKESTILEKNSASFEVAWKTASVLSSGKWVKIRTNRRGIYGIPYEKLKTWGFGNPEIVNVFGGPGYKLPEPLNETPPDDLLKNRSWRGKNSAGKDCLFFYSAGSTEWKWDSASRVFRHVGNCYSGNSFYFLSQEGNAAYTVETEASSSLPATHQVSSFDDYLVYETEQYNLIRSGQQWFGEKFIRGFTRTFTLECDDPAQGSAATLIINAAGRSSSASSLDISVNSVRFQGIVFDPVNMDNSTTLYADETQVNLILNPVPAKSDVTLTYNASNSLSEAWLDYILLNWRRNLRLSGDELAFRDTRSVGSGNIARFIIENASTGVRVLDVTDPTAVLEIIPAGTGSQLVFQRPADQLREYVVFRPGGTFPEPVFVGEVPNQNLHAIEVPEFLIITHPDFLSSANEIADFHRRDDNLDVKVVRVGEVYNEFGNGSPDASAIRNFIRMCYDRSKKIRYVLLMGDGSFDNRNLTKAGKAYIPTYQSENSLLPTSSFVSDDYFVILDSNESIINGTIDLGIGRLPVSTRYEAQIVTDKIIHYYSEASMGLWRTNLCFIGDDGDGNLHVSDSESLADQVNAFHREFQTEKIYFDAYVQESTPGGERYPGVMEAINQQVKKGVLILNYVGHANDRYLADERVLDVSAINSWSNRNNLPIFVTATCEFSRFDANETSAGEYILLNPNGGGIGLFSTTRVVYAYSNYLLSKSFYQYVFEKDTNGINYRMGDIMRLAKVNTVNSLNQRNFTLLADPALRLSYPRYRVTTKTLNGKDAQMVPDTLHALKKVTVAGEITDHAGRKLTAFNGQVTAVVYDKAVVQKTLGNGGESPFSYKSQSNIIYKGEAGVVNGDFSFSFVVPRDISYYPGKGKILYYARSGNDDANGAFENFVIGGSSGHDLTDTRGPDISLFIGDSSFRSGDQTNRNPLMLAEISDENGINTAGTGIGHDIVAILDDDYSNILLLNEYYSAEKDDYRKGSIRYQLGNLEPGEHTLRLKVWDVANNSSEAEIRFVVTSDFYIEETSNYPNPVTDHTFFTFVHNQPDGRFSTLIEIFDLFGRRVDSFTTKTTSSGTRSNPVRWDLRERGISLKGGIYLYRIIIRSSDGKLASKSGKMFVSR
jgi:hypothetical protein